jgi:formate dehydrogenase
VLQAVRFRSARAARVLVYLNLLLPAVRPREKLPKETLGVPLRDKLFFYSKNDTKKGRKSWQISVSEHVAMVILSLVHNYIPSYQWVVKGGWNIADCVTRSYDVEGMHVGTVAAGRIGLAVSCRLKPFDMHLHYYDRHRLPEAVEKELNLIWHPHVEDMVKVCDVVTINCPLHPETQHLFDERMISKMKRGAFIVNMARGKICDRDAIARALESGQLAGYAGDVWFPQPPPKDHPWRTMPHYGMTPHISGTSLSAQARYAAGTREILECYFESRPIRDNI